MSCGHCVKSVEEALKNLPLEKYKVEIGSASVEFDEDKISKEKIINAINETGYEASE